MPKIPLGRICICARSWVHCHTCGSRSVYMLMEETESKKMERRITKQPETEVYRCRSCMKITVLDEICNAEPLKGMQDALIEASAMPSVTPTPTTETKNEELPSGWARNAAGKIESPVSLSDILTRNPERERGD